MSNTDPASVAPVDVIVIGGGVAGRTGAIFTARNGLDTILIDSGGSLLRRNAHLENFPGFPAGVNARLLLELIGEQAVEAGCTVETDTVSRLSADEQGFAVETESADRFRARAVIAATKNEVAYLEEIDGVGIIDRGKAYVDVDDRGRTGVSGLYAAGRLAEKPHQAIVCAGHGAEVAITLLEDLDQPFYHDWVAPDGYFTGRDRDVPPGCEEIDDGERRTREERSMQVMQDRFAERHPDEQETHPSLN